MKTPCVKVCLMDPEHGRCHGCHRTLEEIGRWGGMTDTERDAIMAQLPERKRQQAASSDVAKVPVPPLS